MHRLIAVTVLIGMLALAGCKAAATDAGATTTGPAATTTEAMPGARRGNDIMTLALGTLALDGTASAVDAAQAAQLLPLWKGYRALLASDATAPAELTALVTQIRGTMTAAQTTALVAQIDPAAQSALMAKFGLEMPALGAGPGTGPGALPEGMTEEELQAAMAERQAARAAGTGDDAPSFGVQGGGPEGGPPEGGGRDGGPMGSGGIVMRGDGFEGPGLAGAAGGPATGANTWIISLVDAVISYLEEVH
jgi:hypothetical protein